MKIPRMLGYARLMVVWIVLLAIGAFVPVARAGEPPAGVASSRKPNIIVILADDLGYGVFFV